jgi:hypothetical protein
MGTVRWPDRRRVPKRQRRFSAHDVPQALAENRWQCRTCSGVIASDEDVYCMSCKMYWEDVKKGLFSDD